jgi:hypothetical protein
MTTHISPAQEGGSERRTRWLRFLVAEAWPSMAIAVIWLSVLFDALWGPDIIASSAGASYTRIPSAILVAFFAYLATRVVARYGFGAVKSDDR